jgi:hypothetical protein
MRLAQALLTLKPCKGGLDFRLVVEAGELVIPGAFGFQKLTRPGARQVPKYYRHACYDYGDSDYPFADHWQWRARDVKAGYRFGYP